MTTTSEPGNGQVDGIEVEWQFDAFDLRPAERWLTSLSSARSFPPLGPVAALPKPAVTQNDRYLDSEDWRVARAGYVLRVRAAKEKHELTLKAVNDAPSSGSEPRRRREISEPLASPLSQWLENGGPVGSRVSALVGRRPLQPVLELQTQRRPFVLQVAGETVGEVALDETTISMGSQSPTRLLRVEVEVDSEWVSQLSPVVEDLRRSCGLALASLSKFEAGILARGCTIPDGVDLGPTEIDADTTIGALADAMVRRQLTVLLNHEPGTRLGEDPEELHDMRVATRRLRAALDVFGEVLPPQFAVLSPEVAWLTSVLGSVRDLDVQLERLDDAPEWHTSWESPVDAPIGELRARIETERESARRELLHALESPRYERLTTALVALAQQGATERSTTGRVPAVEVLPGLIEPRHTAAVRAAKRAKRSGEAADFHRLRIRCKRLRYALEFVEEVYGEPATQFIRKMARLQDHLGRLQDCEVGIERLRHMATAIEPPLSPSTVFLMGAVSENYRYEQTELLHNARSRVRVLRGSAWNRLARTLNERQSEAVLSRESDQEASPDVPIESDRQPHAEPPAPLHLVDPAPTAGDPISHPSAPRPPAPGLHHNGGSPAHLWPLDPH
jgi:triphosphatase